MFINYSLPILFLKFWFFEAPREIFFYFLSFNNAFLQLFSLPLLLRTFFKPIKNEYRKGLVGFSIGMGMFIKTWIIALDLFVLAILMLFELTFLVGFVLWPLAAIVVLFL